VLDDGPAGGTDEGRAMAELIFDVAPGVNFRYHSGMRSAADMADAYDELQEAGADIITDDLAYFTEPVFQDGQIVDAKDTVYLNHGVLVFGSAGNYDSEGYLSGWSDPDGDDFHNFQAGDETLNVTLAPNEVLQVILHWDEPWGDASTDIDIELWDSDIDSKLADSDIDNNPIFSSGNPLEWLTYKTCSTTETRPPA
jgi:hypothetical protein